MFVYKSRAFPRFSMALWAKALDSLGLEWAYAGGDEISVPSRNLSIVVPPTPEFTPPDLQPYVNRAMRERTVFLVTQYGPGEVVLIHSVAWVPAERSVKTSFRKPQHVLDVGNREWGRAVRHAGG